MTIGDIIRNRRKELGMNQKDLADAVGTTTATVSRWESGDIRKMKASHIHKVSQVLNLNVRLFFQRNEILTIEEEKMLYLHRKAFFYFRIHGYHQRTTLEALKSLHFEAFLFCLGNREKSPEQTAEFCSTPNVFLTLSGTKKAPRDLSQGVP